MEALGHTLKEEGYPDVPGSTDFGNVSQVVPAMAANFAICGKEAGWHSKEVAAATRTQQGHRALRYLAKTLAMTALDLLGNPDLIAQAKREHEEAMAPVREGLAKLTDN